MFLSTITRRRACAHALNFSKPKRSVLRLLVCSTRLISSKRLTFEKYGEPLEVITQDEVDVANIVSTGEVLVKMLASVVNPMDINIIQGTYPTKPKMLPAVGGSEGVGVIIEIGDGPNPFKLRKGQWVVPDQRSNLIGTWQGYVIGKKEDFIPVPWMDAVSAATISVNPPSAYLMLKEFEDLKAGDTVIQNGGNSAVGQAVIQFCRIFGLKSVWVVRNRDNISELKEKLLGLGDENTKVITEEEMDESFSHRAQLALNCIGGRSGTNILRVLEPGRTHVTYGGMSRQPVIIPTAQLIFTSVKIRGFWLGRWISQNTTEKRVDMFREIGQLCIDGKFRPPEHKIIHLDQYKEALENSMKGFSGLKYILTYD